VVRPCSSSMPWRPAGGVRGQWHGSDVVEALRPACSDRWGAVSQSVAAGERRDVRRSRVKAEGRLPFSCWFLFPELK